MQLHILHWYREHLNDAAQERYDRLATLAAWKGIKLIVDGSDLTIDIDIDVWHSLDDSATTDIAAFVKDGIGYVDDIIRKFLEGEYQTKGDCITCGDDLQGEGIHGHCPGCLADLNHHKRIGEAARKVISFADGKLPTMPMDAIDTLRREYD